MSAFNTDRQAAERGQVIMPGAPRRRSLATLLLAISALLLLALPASASAAIPTQVWQTPPEGSSESLGGAIGVDPASGNLYLASDNNGIVALSPWGQLLRSFGWGVVKSGPGNQPSQNEVQQLTVSATSGTYRLRALLRGAVLAATQPIAFDAPASSVQAALEAANVGPGNVAVSGGPGNGAGANPYTIEFTGARADFDVPPIQVTGSTLAGGAASATVETLQEGGSYEVCVPVDGDVCQAARGVGTFPGELGVLASGVAVGGEGGVFVFDVTLGAAGEEKSFRIQKFDAEGDFLLMWGGEVNKTSGADRCTKADLEAGDECGAGVPGAGPGEFEGGNEEEIGGIAVGPEGNVFVGNKERIQRFDPQGNYLGEVAVPGETVRALAMDATGNFYVTYQGENDVRKLSPTGAELQVFTVKAPGSQAVDSDNNLYVREEQPSALGGPRILKYSPAGTCLICPGDLFGSPYNPEFLATSSACGVPSDTLYATLRDSQAQRSFLRAYGSPPDPDLCPPPQRAPEITDQYALSVDPDGAVVRAEINPNFWTDTRYYVQYGTGECSAGGCTQTQPLSPGSLLTDQVTNAALKSGGVFLSGLQPSTTYHYRFIAESSGGGPVYGIDPDGNGPKEASLTEGTEASFTTFPTATPPNTSCANQVFRTGPSAALPDCRAYEMVSPVDKENGDIVSFTAADHAYAALNQSSADGDKLAYSAFRAFGDAESSPITSAYIATRGADGWSSDGISPPLGAPVLDVVQSLNNQFKAFSDDLCTAWLMDGSDLPLAAGAVADFPNLYRRQNCGPQAGTYAPLSTVEPPATEPSQYLLEPQGVSGDGTQMIFTAPDALTASAPTPSLGNTMLYEAFGNGKLRFVCVRPNGSPVGPAGCSAGTNNGLPYGRYDAVHNAISADGSRIFWSDGSKSQARLYVRINGKTTQQLTTEPARYWTAAEDGSRAIYTIGDLNVDKAELFEYDVDAEESHELAGEVSGLLGASEDATQIYFVSGEDLDEGATAGQPNLYLDEDGAGGEVAFLATLAEGDISATSGARSLVAVAPRNHTAQVSPDGSHAIFMSKANPTGFDNVDVTTGDPDDEVFLYDAGEGELHCISCNPTGARPVGRELHNGQSDFWGVAKIPTSQSQLYAKPRLISDDGSRAYFESVEALVLADTNGAQDVYQWEEPGAGDCSEASPAFNALNGGCLSLISSGESPVDSEIIDVSPSGNDVFFATEAALLPQDKGLIDVYDARVGGGYPQPEGVAECEGEACQGPYDPPEDPTPASSSYEGPGNPSAAKATKPRCGKGKRAVRRGGKTRCVAKQQAGKNGKKQRPGKRQGKANQERRAGR